MENFYQKLSGYHAYFDDIRKRVYSLAIVFIVFFAIGFMESGNILRMIMGIFDLQNVTIVTTSPFQFLDLATKVGLYSGLLVCLPLLIYHAYDFLKDGLTHNEKKLFFVSLPIGLLLFAIGFSYCFAILYFYLTSVSTLNLSFGIKNVWDVSSFMSQIIWASTYIGLVFQFPLVLTFLIRARLVKVDFLRQKRFYAVASIFVFVGFLPPPDIFSTLLEALPLVVLYQITIWVNSAFSARKTYPVKIPDVSALNVVEPAT